MKKTRYHIIKSHEELERLIECCKSTNYASVDWETNAKPLYVKEFKPTILSVSWRPGYGASIPCDHFQTKEYTEKGWEWLKEITYFGREVIEDPNITKVAWNWKFDNQIFYKYGIYYSGTVIDGMLAKYLLNEERPNGLKDMVRKYIPEFANYEKYDGFDSIPWDKKELEPLSKYGCMDTDATLRLSLFFENKLISLGFYNVYRNLLMAASRVLQSAETHGMPFDTELNAKLKVKYDALINEYESKLRSNPVVLKYEKHQIEYRKEKYIEKLREDIELLEKEDKPSKRRSIALREEKISRILAGEFQTNDEKKLIEPFNFKSVPQLCDILYLNKHGFKFPILLYTTDKKTKKQSNNPSTAEDTLIKLKPYDKSGFIDTLLDLRGVQTINSTFIYGLGDLVQDDNCVHPRFLIHGCVSGNTKLVGKESDIVIQDICPKSPGVLNVEKNNIWVLSHEGTWEQITHTINKGVQPLYKLTTEDGRVLECTKQHKLLTTKGWKQVSQIYKQGLNLIMFDVTKLDINKPVVGKGSSEVIFKDIPMWPGYLASSEGKIYSVKVTGGKGILDYNHPHELIPRERKPGRKTVYFRNGTRKKYAFSVSRLVYMAFNNLSKIPDNKVIDHINCDPSDNRPENLQCISPSENIQRAYKYTRTAYTNNGINGMVKFDTLTVGKILEEYNNGANGITQHNLCKKYGISQKQVSGIVRKERRKEIYLTKIISLESLGNKMIYDLSVNHNHSYITRSNFVNSNTTSGRLSSQEPNGQNIPKTMVNPDVKLQFIPPKGELFLTYDYSQAELRILAHLAGEKTMLEWFRTGKDIHLASACKKYHEDYDKIKLIYEDEQHPEYPKWKKRRKQSKTINFGIVYCQTAMKLAESLSTEDEPVSTEEAQVFQDEFFETFPKIRKFMSKQNKFMEEHGYVKSLFGRKRRCPKVYSEKYGEYLEALRQSVNAPVQSAASDMALFASVIVYEEVKKGILPPMKEVDTVHDSVYQFIKPKYLTPDTIYKIWDICRNPETKKYFGFSIDDVDMSMDFTVGRTMAEELPFNPRYNYEKMLSPDFDIKEYYEEYNKYKHIPISDYNKVFKEDFKISWRQR